MNQERNNRLLNAKLNKYIIPGIMMSLALQLGNIVDTIFVSNLIGVDAMAAVTMSLPVETVIQLVGYCLGIGGSIAAGIMLGKRDKETASKLFSATLIVTFLVGIIFYTIAHRKRACTGWRSFAELYEGLYLCKYAWRAGHRCRVIDGQLSWRRKSSGACIGLSDRCQRDQPYLRLHIPEIYANGDQRCSIIHSAGIFAWNGYFYPLYSVR